MSAETITQSLLSKNGINVLRFAWKTDGSGNFTAVESKYPIDGYIIAFLTNPGAAAPTASYDPSVVNSDGVDLSGGALVDRSATASEIVMPLVNSEVVKMPVLGKVTFDVAAAGNDKNGVLDIYFVRY